MGAPVKVVFHGPRDIRVEPASSPPRPGPGEVVVKVEACAICGSDLKTWENGNPRIKPPRTMGHELCGTVTEVGEGVRSYRPGQRVTMATTMGCGRCAACTRGTPNLCYELQAVGFHCDGAMAPYLRVPERGVAGGNMIDVGDLDPAFAALSEPVSCVVNSLSRLAGRAVETMLVIGLGPLGIIHGLLARDRGIATVVGVGRGGPRLERARAFGFDDIVSSHEIDAAITRWTQGRGFDAVIVTAPSAEMQAAAPGFAAKSGAISLFASLPKGAEMISINSRTVHYGEQLIYGTSDSTPLHVRTAVDWIQRHVEDLQPLVTHRLPLERFGDGLEAMVSRNALKVVLLPAERA